MLYILEEAISHLLVESRSTPRNIDMFPNNWTVQVIRPASTFHTDTSRSNMEYASTYDNMAVRHRFMKGY